MYILIDNRLEICDKSFKTTIEGFLQLDAIIARSGTQEYLAHELGIFDGDPNRIVILDRPAEFVTDSMSVASFINVPVTDDHPTEGQVNSKNYSSLTKGVVVDASPTKRNQVRASIIVQDETLIQKIKDGKTELSAGYTAEIEFSDDGKSAVQKKIRGNHVAFVDAARCGKECSILDSKPNTPKGDKIMAKIKINNVQYEVDDAVAQPIQNLIDENSGLSKKLLDGEKKASAQLALYDAEKEKGEEMKKKLEDEEEDKDEKEKKIEDAANERLGVLISASKFVKDYDPTGKSLNDIKRDVVTDALPNLDLKDRDETYVNARFDILVEDGVSSQQKLNDGLSHQMKNDIDMNDAVAVARGKKMERSANAYKPAQEK